MLNKKTESRAVYLTNIMISFANSGLLTSFKMLINFFRLILNNANFDNLIIKTTWRKT